MSPIDKLSGRDTTHCDVTFKHCSEKLFRLPLPPKFFCIMVDNTIYMITLRRYIQYIVFFIFAI